MHELLSPVCCFMGFRHLIEAQQIIIRKQRVIFMNSNIIDSHKRIHTVTWDDPKVSSRDAGKISGMDYLTSIRDGSIKPPPIAMLVGYRIREVDSGRTVFELRPEEYHYNPFSTVHGGVAGTILDTSMTSAVLSTLPTGLSCATLEIKINFVHPIKRSTGIIQCEGKIIHKGNRISTAEAKIVDLNGKLYAHAGSTIMIFKDAGKK